MAVVYTPVLNGACYRVFLCSTGDRYVMDTESGPALSSKGTTWHAPLAQV